MDHYESAERLLQLADDQATEAMLTSDMENMIAKTVSAISYLIAAQTHATLAIVDEMRRDDPK